MLARIRRVGTLIWLARARLQYEAGTKTVNRQHLSIGYQSLLEIHARFGALVDWQARPPERFCHFYIADNSSTSIPRFASHFPVACLPRARLTSVHPSPHQHWPQGLSMLVYYPLEHANYLASHSILLLSLAELVVQVRVVELPGVRAYVVASCSLCI